MIVGPARRLEEAHRRWRRRCREVHRMDVLDTRPEPCVEFVIRRDELAEELGRAGPVKNDDHESAAVRVLLEPGRVRREPHALVHLVELRLAGAVHLGRPGLPGLFFPRLDRYREGLHVWLLPRQGTMAGEAYANRCVRAMPLFGEVTT